MPPKSFLLLSDLHFGRDGFEPSFQKFREPESDSTECPINGIIEVARAQGVSGIIVPGDLTSIGAPSEFHGSAKTIQRIAKRLGIPDSCILHTYGNHDINWAIGKLAIDNEKNVIEPFFKALASSLPEHIINEFSIPLKKGPQPGSGLFKLSGVNIIMLNSSLGSQFEESFKHGSVCEPQLTWLKDTLENLGNTNEFTLLVVHHHLYPHLYPKPIFDYSHLKEGPQILELAGSYGVDLIIHGHCHHPNLITSIQAGWKRPMTILCCGSVGVDGNHRDNSNIPNLFHILEIGGRNANGAAEGTIKTFEYSGSGTWEPSLFHARNSPIDPRSNFGSPISGVDAKSQAKEFLHSSPDGVKINWDRIPYNLRCLRMNDLIELLRNTSAETGGSVFISPEESIIILPGDGD